jgi:hypothetical protein
MNQIFECPKCHEQFKKKIYLTKHVSQKTCDNLSIDISENAESTISSPIDRNIKSYDELSLLSNNDSIENTKDQILELKMENNLILNFIKQQDEMIKNMKFMMEKLTVLEKKFDEINSKSLKKEYQMTDVKKEIFNINEKIIIDCLSKCSIDSDAEIIYYYYFENRTKDKYPIRNIQKNDFQFWDGGEWIYDKNGNILKDILISNLKRTYLKHNTLNCSNNYAYLERQQHIVDLDDKKNHNGLLDIIRKNYL